MPSDWHFIFFKIVSNKCDLSFIFFNGDISEKTSLFFCCFGKHVC